MGKEIRGSSTATGKFPPIVRLENIGDYVEGKVVATRVLPPDTYGHSNTAISIELMALEGGSTQISVAKGQYQEVDVFLGDVVDFIGRGTDLREKIPQVKVGDVVAITNVGEAPKVKGRNSKKLFKVEVE